MAKYNFDICPSGVGEGEHAAPGFAEIHLAQEASLS